MVINIKNSTNMEQDINCLKLKKPCTCTYYCLNRPVIDVEYIEEQGAEKYLGKIEDEFDFYHFTFNVYDSSGAKLFRIFTGCCQQGILCQGYPCKACEKVDFQVFDKDG